MEGSTIQLGEAVKQMRESTLKGIPFSFSFCSYNKSKHTSKGIVKVESATIRSKASAESVLLEYFDEIDQEPKHCYIPLLNTFNGQTITI